MRYVKCLLAGAAITVCINAASVLVVIPPIIIIIPCMGVYVNANGLPDYRCIGSCPPGETCGFILTPSGVLACGCKPKPNPEEVIETPIPAGAG